MKGFLSILFTCILLFSLCGYRLVIDVLQHQAQTAMANQIERGIDDGALVSLKVPASLPYYTNSKDFQYISGEVVLQGMVYQYVKRRIYNDSIEYLCLQNPVKTKLLNAREQFYQLAYDLQLNKTKSGKQHTEIKPLMLEYCPAGKFCLPLPVAASSKRLSLFYVRPIAALPLATPAEPPEST